MAKSIFGGLTRRAAHDHAANELLLLFKLSLEFPKPLKTVRHHSLTTAVTVGSETRYGHAQLLHIPWPSQSSQ
jgi:hypothetical protein